MTPAAWASSPISRARKSHAIVSQALEILANLDHRGAVGADPLLGDGAGILIQIPDPLYPHAGPTAQGLDAAAAGRLRGGDVLPAAATTRRASSSCGQFEKFIAKEGQRLIGWRDVPTTLDGLGKAVLASMPVIRQCFVGARRQLRRPGRVRAQADRDPQADPEPARRRWPRSTACPG